MFTVAVAGTNRGNRTVAAQLLPGNPYDGHMPAGTLSVVEGVTGVAVTDVYVDKSYRGQGYAGATKSSRVEGCKRWDRMEFRYQI